MAYTKTNWVNGTTPVNDTNMNKIENALENLDTNISKSTDEYSSTRTYSIGELVIYNNKLYKANQDITTAEAFNSSHWTEVTLLSDVNEIKSVVNNNADNLNKMDEEIANAVEKSDLLNLTYPVGSIYMSVNNTSPANLFGGKWEQLKDRFLLGAGSSYSNGKTGGEATHTLTTAEMPSHNHNSNVRVQWYNDNNAWGLQTTDIANSNFRIDSGAVYTSNTGSGQAHNNMPPYLVVFMWKRTA